MLDGKHVVMSDVFTDPTVRKPASIVGGCPPDVRLICATEHAIMIDLHNDGNEKRSDKHCGLEYFT